MLYVFMEIKYLLSSISVTSAPATITTITKTTPRAMAAALAFGSDRPVFDLDCPAGVC